MEILKRILFAIAVGAVVLFLGWCVDSTECDCDECEIRRDYESDHIADSYY